MTATFAHPRIESEPLPDGRMLLRSTEQLSEHPVSVVHEFRRHTEEHPDRVLVAERMLDGCVGAAESWGEVRRPRDLWSPRGPSSAASLTVR